MDRAAVDLPILTEESDVHELLSSSEITAIQSDRKRPQKVTEVIIGSDESSEDESDDEVICTFAQSGPSTFHCELPTITQLPAVKKSEEKSDEDDNGDVTVEEMLNDFVDV